MVPELAACAVTVVHARATSHACALLKVCLPVLW